MRAPVNRHRGLRYYPASSHGKCHSREPDALPRCSKMRNQRASRLTKIADSRTVAHCHGIEYSTVRPFGSDRPQDVVERIDRASRRHPEVLLRVVLLERRDLALDPGACQRPRLTYIFTQNIPDRRLRSGFGFGSASNSKAEPWSTGRPLITQRGRANGARGRATMATHLLTTMKVSPRQCRRPRVAAFSSSTRSAGNRPFQSE